MRSSLLIVSILLISLGLASAQQSFFFTGNLSASTINDNGWHFTPIQFSSYNLALWLGANYWSAEVSGNILNGTADVVTGSAYVGLGGYPFSFLSYFDAKYALNFGIGSGQNFANLNVNAAAGYIGTAYLRLEEHDPQGNLVATKSLKWVDQIFQKGLTWGQTVSNSSNPTLNYVVYNASDSQSAVKISMTFLVASVAGVINNNIPIVPKSLEAVIAITNYPYNSTSNTLSLVIGVGYGGANLTASGRSVRSQGSNVYYSLSDKVSVAGSTQDAKISAYVDANIDSEVSNAQFKSQLSGKYGGSYSFNIVKVTFPAGADHIVYDPSSGNGNSVLDSSAGAVAASFTVLVMTVVIALLM